MKRGRFEPVGGWTAKYEIEVLYRDGSGNMWVGTDGAGLFRYSEGRFTNYTTSAGLGSNQSARSGRPRRRALDQHLRQWSQQILGRALFDLQQQERPCRRPRGCDA